MKKLKHIMSVKFTEIIRYSEQQREQFEIAVMGMGILQANKKIPFSYCNVTIGCTFGKRIQLSIYAALLMHIFIYYVLHTFWIAIKSNDILANKFIQLENIF